MGVGGRNKDPYSVAKSLLTLGGPYGGGSLVEEREDGAGVVLVHSFFGICGGS